MCKKSINDNDEISMSNAAGQPIKLGDRMVKINTICAQNICLIRADKHFSSVSFFKKI